MCHKYTSPLFHIPFLSRADQSKSKVKNYRFIDAMVDLILSAPKFGMTSVQVQGCMDTILYAQSFISNTKDIVIKQHFLGLRAWFCV